jgi:glycosyltransferase involved in cell wall biosynthesis
MRAAIANPYLDTLGGGERYTMSFAKVLVDHGYQVDVEWQDPKIVDALETRFGLNLDKIKIVDDVKRGDGYDVCFWVSDGSIPALKARKNFLHFQVPFQGVNGKSLLNKMKLFRVNKVICNSNFTKKYIDKEFGVDSLVIYPPVDVHSIKPKRKENLILYVGRFSRILQSKGQDVLIKSFNSLCDQGLRDWKFVLAGGVEIGVGDYIDKLKDLAKGYPIDIIESPDYKTLKDLYGKAKIFWSASGFGVNENENPERVEHFGITVVEAMAAGAVPIVYNAGGHREIVKSGENGFLWTKENELMEITSNLINVKGQIGQFSVLAKKYSKLYSKEMFDKEVANVI